MNALVLALLLGAAPESSSVAETSPVVEPAAVAESSAPSASATTAAASPRYRLQTGGQVGFPYLVGANAIATMYAEGSPRFDVDVAWEPSLMLQSYSVGGAYHVLDGPFFVGGRVRLVQFQPPWGRSPALPFLGAGLELGGRFRVGPEDKGLVTLALHGSMIPAQATNLQTLVGLSLGFAWTVLQR